jgi:hypothetical protein
MKTVRKVPNKHAKAEAGSSAPPSAPDRRRPTRLQKWLLALAMVAMLGWLAALALLAAR